MDPAELELLTQTLRKTMTTTAPGPALDAALAGLGWRELLAEFPGPAVATVFRLLGETGAHASALTDVAGNGDTAVCGRPVGGVGVRSRRAGCCSSGRCWRTTSRSGATGR
ncbi:hypothetical protein ABZ372_28720, partial [Streptomyces sp. NPDC005921]